MFRLALRQTEGLIGSVIQLLGLDLAVPDHSTLSRRAETLEVPRPRCGREPVHLLVDSTGLRLCGPGEWLAETHGERGRRTWRKLVWGSPCQAFIAGTPIRCVVSPGVAERRRRWRRPEGSSPSGADHRTTNLYSVGPARPEP